MLPKVAEVINDMRYGPGKMQTLDFYRPLTLESESLPLILFIHGGYWRGLDKHDHSFIVPPLIKAGAVVANINYDLCPQVNLDQMVREIVSALRFTVAFAKESGIDPNGVFLIGHSAGAHLSARVLNQPADDMGLPADLISGVAAISGIYEPEIILKLDVNEEAQITKEEAIRNDCLKFPPLGAARMMIWAGADEPQGWIDQSYEYASLVLSKGINAYTFLEKRTDHFTVLERAFQADSQGWQSIIKLCELK